MGRLASPATARRVLAGIDGRRLGVLSCARATARERASLVQYTPQTSTALIPLLQDALSKTDTERLLVVSPELADVLATAIHRIRQPTGPSPACLPNEHHHRTRHNNFIERTFGETRRRVKVIGRLPGEDLLLVSGLGGPRPSERRWAAPP
ncbi:hypothetical protein GCM10023322_50930 [Rugosimonospora acidiphila]|uniref:Transposase n=1 Tax=Rugosimonospora acidiphila TaxID=556531 RepID=A0ABP9S939_9ACTN